MPGGSGLYNQSHGGMIGSRQPIPQDQNNWPAAYGLGDGQKAAGVASGIQTNVDIGQIMQMIASGATEQGGPLFWAQEMLGWDAKTALQNNPDLIQGIMQSLQMGGGKPPMMMGADEFAKWQSGEGAPGSAQWSSEWNGNLEGLAAELAKRSEADFQSGVGALTSGRAALRDDPNMSEQRRLTSGLQANPDILSNADIDMRIGEIADTSARGVQQGGMMMSNRLAASGMSGGGGLAQGLGELERGHQDRIAGGQRQMAIQQKELNRQGLMQALGAGEQFQGSMRQNQMPFDMAESNAYLDRRYAVPEWLQAEGMARDLGMGNNGMGQGQGIGWGSPWGSAFTPEHLGRDRDLWIARGTNTFPLGFGSDITGFGGSFDRSMASQFNRGAKNPALDKFGIQGDYGKKLMWGPGLTGAFGIQGTKHGPQVLDKDYGNRGLWNPKEAMGRQDDRGGGPRR